jgi:outer membrane immunogenic protein
MRSVLSASLLGAVLLSVPAASQAADRWTGIYVGGNVGYAVPKLESTDQFLQTNGPAVGITPLAFPAGQRFPGDDAVDRLSGFAGGGQIGYNQQFGIYVFGIEADIQAGDMESSNHFLGDPVAGPTFDTKAEIEYFGTVRAKAGVIMDGVLVYATGGFAYAQGKGSLKVAPGGPGAAPDPAYAGPYNGTDEQGHTGWVVGAGAEIPLTSFISFKAEFMHLELSEETYRFNLAGTGDGSYSQANEDISINVMRTGLNFKF